MRNNFDKINYGYSVDKLRKIDFRSYGEQALDYAKDLAKEANAENEKFVQNNLKAIEKLGHNYSIARKLVSDLEKRLGKIINRKRKKSQSNVPDRQSFQNGVIDTGTIVGTDINAKLRIDQFSGNMVIYGNFGLGKTNQNLYMIPQLVSQNIHIDIFDITTDYRDLLQIPECRNGVVLNRNNNQKNPFEPIGPPQEHLQFFWEITSQDFKIKDETRQMLFNYSEQLYRTFGVYEGKAPPTLFDLKQFLEKERSKKSTSKANRNKIGTALEKLAYIQRSFGRMINCNRGYSLDFLDSFDIVCHEIGDLSEDNRSWYTKLNLKQYYQKGLESEERHKVNRIIVIDEAKGIFGKSRIGEATNYIKDMFTRSRPIGCWWLISDQFATELADFTRAANCQICFQHSVPKEIREISTAMGCNEALRLEIPRLGRHRALQKITDFPFPYQIVTYKSKVRRHIGDVELNRLMQKKLARFNSISEKNGKRKKVKVVTSATIKQYEFKKVKQQTPIIATTSIRKNPLEDLEKFLRFIRNNPGMKLTDIYKSLKFSGRKGDTMENNAKDNQLIEEKTYQIGRKGRPAIELELTERGREYINEK